MRGSQKRKKGKAKDKAPKSPPAAKKLPKITFRVPTLPSEKAQAGPAVPPTVSPRTPELAPEAGQNLPLDKHSGIYISRVPLVASPRQQLIDQFWEDHGSDSDTPNLENEDLGLEPINKAHAQRGDIDERYCGECTVVDHARLGDASRREDFQSWLHTGSIFR